MENRELKFQAMGKFFSGQRLMRNIMTDEYSVQSRRGLCVKTGQLRVELIALKVV
jgi:hypothetical protein